MKKITQHHKRLNVAKVLSEFQNLESSPAHRKGTFKIDALFEKALKTFLKAKPEPKKSKSN